MMRRNRAHWLYQISLAEHTPYPFRFGRGVYHLRRWLWKHGLVEVATPNESVVLTAKGHASLRQWTVDAARHGLKL